MTDPESTLAQLVARLRELGIDRMDASVIPTLLGLFNADGRPSETVRLKEIELSLMRSSAATHAEREAAYRAKLAYEQTRRAVLREEGRERKIAELKREISSLQERNDRLTAIGVGLLEMAWRDLPSEVLWT